MSEENGYKKLCKVNDLKEKCGKRFLIDDVEVAVFKVNGQIYALSNICPHQHASLIYDGFIEEDCVICPVHGWEFNLQTGKMKTGSRRLEVYPVKILGEDIFIQVLRKELRW